MTALTGGTVLDVAKTLCSSLDVIPLRPHLKHNNPDGFLQAERQCPVYLHLQHRTVPVVLAVTSLDGCTGLDHGCGGRMVSSLRSGALNRRVSDLGGWFPTNVASMDLAAKARLGVGTGKRRLTSIWSCSYSSMSLTNSPIFRKSPQQMYCRTG